MSRAIYFHAGCPVCVDAESSLISQLKGEVEKVHLGEQPDRIAQAQKLGIKSVPALALDGQIYHINHGADLTQLLS